ncbi:MAG: hypothetical protein ABI655_03855, partial [Phenylobacterium sp.]
MFKPIPGVVLVPSRTEPTSLLKLVTGGFAPQVAALWPEPHAAFLTAPVARRHLVCLALALGRAPAVVGDLLAGRLRRAIRAVLAPPPGLERALGRLGEVAWSPEGYRR